MQAGARFYFIRSEQENKKTMDFQEAMQWQYERTIQMRRLHTKLTDKGRNDRYPFVPGLPASDIEWSKLGGCHYLAESFAHALYGVHNVMDAERIVADKLNIPLVEIRRELESLHWDILAYAANHIEATYHGRLDPKAVIRWCSQELQPRSQEVLMELLFISETDWLDKCVQLYINDK